MEFIAMPFFLSFLLLSQVQSTDTAPEFDAPQEMSPSDVREFDGVIEAYREIQLGAPVAAMFHQAFLMGALYELDISGHITRRLFENLNQRFNRTSAVNKFITMLYGEVSEDATFRFLSAGHPSPAIFSAMNDRFMEVSPESFTSFPPLGTFPSQNVVDKRQATRDVLGFKDRYEVNEWTLMGAGDILLLHSDGLLEHARGNERYFPDQLEQTIRGAKQLSATDIVHTIIEDIRAFADPVDDVSLVVLKRC